MKALEYIFDDMLVGKEAAYDYIISDKVYLGYIEISGDVSPIHIDSEVAITSGFKERVMHGGILNAFVSHFIGMVFPGKNGLLLSVDIRFNNPSYMWDALHITGKISKRSESLSVIEIQIAINNITQNAQAASGKALVKLCA